MFTQLYASLLALTIDWQVLSIVSTPAVVDPSHSSLNSTHSGQASENEEPASSRFTPELQARWDSGLGAITKCTVPGTVALTFVSYLISNRCKGER